MLVRKHGIEPWRVMDYVNHQWDAHAGLVGRSPLRKIHVKDGFDFIKQRMAGSKELSKEAFVRICKDMLIVKAISSLPHEIDTLNEVFDGLDFDKSGSIELGELAGGAAHFFRGTEAERMQAVFEMLDADGSGEISKDELEEWLTPFVNVMIPDPASPLRSHIIGKVVNDIHLEMDEDRENDISYVEMAGWIDKGNTIVHSAAASIERGLHTVHDPERQHRRWNHRKQMYLDACIEKLCLEPCHAVTRCDPIIV